MADVPTPSYDGDLREIAARAHWAASNGRRLLAAEGVTLGSVHYAHGHTVLVAVLTALAEQVEALCPDPDEPHECDYRNAAALARAYLPKGQT